MYGAERVRLEYRALFESHSHELSNFTFGRLETIMEATLETALSEELSSIIKGENMPAVVFTEIERGIRGKGNEGKKVKFQAISESEPRPDNPMEAALNTVSGDLQAFWERFVLGFNEYAYEAVADPIAEYIDSSWDADKTKNFRMTVNAMAKLTGKEKGEVAQALLAQIG